MIVVFGSINIDLITQVAKIVAPGETVLGSNYTLAPGGKGANQALAAHRAGAQVTMVGTVGKDSFADAALALLREAGLKLALTISPTLPTGTAFISVDRAGQNAITATPGANAQAQANSLSQLKWQPGDTLILQREISEDENLKAALIARNYGARVIYNLAPAALLSQRQLAAIDILVLNETEAMFLASAMSLDNKTLANFARAFARAQGVSIIITLGTSGAMLAKGPDFYQTSAPKVNVLDTIGAGDAFVGALAAALDRGASIETALQYGVAAGSLACERRGAQPSLPQAPAILALATTMSAATQS